MNEAVRSVELGPVERQICENPCGNLTHVFVFDEEILGCAAALAHQLFPWPAFAGAMLIEPRRNPSPNVSRKFR